jgi:hypothetical protein
MLYTKSIVIQRHRAVHKDQGRMTMLKLEYCIFLLLSKKKSVYQEEEEEDNKDLFIVHYLKTN